GPDRGGQLEQPGPGDPDQQPEQGDGGRHQHGGEGAGERDERQEQREGGAEGCALGSGHGASLALCRSLDGAPTARGPRRYSGSLRVPAGGGILVPLTTVVRRPGRTP